MKSETNTVYRCHDVMLQIVDMRWGIRDEASNDHMTTKLCLHEIQACKDISVGPYFVVSTIFNIHTYANPSYSGVRDVEEGIGVASGAPTWNILRERYGCHFHICRRFCRTRTATSRCRSFLAPMTPQPSRQRCQLKINNTLPSWIYNKIYLNVQYIRVHVLKLF